MNREVEPELIELQANYTRNGIVYDRIIIAHYEGGADVKTPDGELITSVETAYGLGRVLIDLGRGDI